MNIKAIHVYDEVKDYDSTEEAFDFAYLPYLFVLLLIPDLACFDSVNAILLSLFIILIYLT